MKHLISVELPWRLDSVVEIKMSEEEESLVFLCLVNFGKNKTKNIEISFKVFYSVTSTRILNDYLFSDKYYNWDKIKYRSEFLKDPMNWNKLIFKDMETSNLCPDPFIYIIKNSKDIEQSDIPINQQENFNHYLILSDDFFYEVIASGDISWKEI